MKNLLNTIETYSNKHNLLPKGSTIILGLSGGPDSIFLLHALIRLQEKWNLRLIAAHLDHEWRQDSYKDAKFCQETTDKLGVQLMITAKISDLGLSFKFEGSKEELGRKARRSFLERIAQECQAD